VTGGGADQRAGPARVAVHRNGHHQAALELVPAAITAVYCINFDYMPRLHTGMADLGVPAVVVPSWVGLYAQFRQRDWL